MHTESGVHRALTNSFWNILGYVAPILVAAFVTPIIIFGLGEHNYGVYIFLMTLVSLLGLIDMGFSTAVSKYLTEYHSRGEMEKIRTLARSANTIALIMGVSGFLLAVCAGTWGHSLLKEAAAPEVMLFYILAGLIFFVNTINMMYTITPNALQRFDISMKIGTSLLLLSSLISIVAIKLGYGIPGLLVTQLGLSLAILIVTGLYSRRLLPGVLTFSLGWSGKEIKKIYSFGLRALMASLGSSSSSYVSRLVIPLFLGPSALTYYSVPGSVSSRVPGITNTISSVLFPLTAHLASLGETEKIQITYIRSFRLITILAAAAASSLIFFSETILTYWLDATFAAQSSDVLILLTATSFIMAIYGPLYNFLLGLGKLKMITISSFVVGGLNLLLLFLLMPRFGIMGVAWASFISVLPVGYMIYHTEKQYLCIEGRTHYYLKLALKTILTVTASFIIARFILIPITTSFTILLFTGPTSVLSYLALYKLFGFYDEEDWRDLTHFTQRLFRKKITR